MKNRRDEGETFYPAFLMRFAKLCNKTVMVVYKTDKVCYTTFVR